MRTYLRVGAILFHENGLVTTRMRKHGESYYVLPGGGVEDNESLHDALRRELQEELNIKITKFRLVYIKELNIKEKGRGVEFYFYVEEYSGVPTIGFDPELKDSSLEEIAIISLDELGNYNFFPVQLIDCLKDDKKKNFPNVKHLGLHDYP